MITVDIRCSNNRKSMCYGVAIPYHQGVSSRVGDLFALLGRNARNYVDLSSGTMYGETNFVSSTRRNVLKYVYSTLSVLVELVGVGTYNSSCKNISSMLSQRFSPCNWTKRL